MAWLLFSFATVLLVVVAGRAHSRYLDGLEADPERQLMLGVSFEKPSPWTRPVTARDYGGLRKISAKALRQCLFKFGISKYPEA